MASSANDVLINGLLTKVRLSADDTDILARLQIEVLDIRRGQDVLREGEHPLRSALLISGLTCSYNVRRQH